jgi:N-acetylglucosamine-6-sulfatase
LCLWTLILVGVGFPSEVGAQTDSPNILYIVVDDADAENMEKYMPRTAALVRDRGAEFSNFYVAQAQCCPSRASALLGEYPHNHLVQGNIGPSGGYPRFRSEGHENRTIAAQLQGQGYGTGMHGKYLNDYRHGNVPAGWNSIWIRDNQQMYDYKATITNGDVQHYGTAKAAYADGVTFREAVRFISRRTGPWFEYVTPTAPHSPYTDPPGNQPYTRNDFKRPPSFNEADVSDKPAHIRDYPRITSRNATAIAQRHAGRANKMDYADAQAAEMIRDLRASGELANTYVVVTSDNGWMEGEHRKPDSKGVVYEESTHLPLWISGPGVVPGTKIEAPTSNVDLFATFSDMAGEVTDLRDGIDLLPLMEGTGTTDRQRVLIEGVDDRGSDFDAIVDISHGTRYKYVEYVSGEKELYDLNADPYELESLHASADPALLADLAADLDAMRNCSGDTCRPEPDSNS